MIIAIKRKPTHHSLHWDGCGSTGSPPKEIPADLKVKVETLHNSVQVLFVSKQIPWIIQAQMAEDGYVTMEDLACRWVSAQKAREEGPKDLKFKDGENGFDKAISDFFAMRLYQAVLQARSLIHSVPKPCLEYQGSDSFLKKQFRYCAKGEIGFFAPKHIVSALPEEGERPTKSHRKFTVDGFQKEEEEEERANPQTRRQLERMHTVFRNNLLMCTMAFPQFQQFDITKSGLDEWYDWFYGPSIAGRRPPPSEFTLLWAERNAWRQIYQLIADGSTLKNAMKTIREDQLFWTREVYERVLFQEHLKTNPGKGNGKVYKGAKGGRPNTWPQNWALQTSISNTLAQATAADPMHVQCGSMDGHATETTLQTSVPARESLNPPGPPSF